MSEVEGSSSLEAEDIWEVSYEIRRTTSHESLYKVSISAGSSRLQPFLSTSKKAEAKDEYSELREAELKGGHSQQKEAARGKYHERWNQDPVTALHTGQSS